MTKLGISGNTANKFLTTQITPLLALVGVLLGIDARDLEQDASDALGIALCHAHTRATARHYEEALS